MADQATPLGTATGRTEERLLAAMGQLSGVALRFERCEDVAKGGVLCALPALLAVGLLRGVRQCFPWQPGDYPLEAIFLTLALLALARVRSLEALRYEPPGEWGKVLGLDRIPEVRTLREKLDWLCQEPEARARWGQQLAAEWMAAHPNEGGFYYVDGHVRVYHGEVALRPRAYVAREQLCLRASLDYWVNAMDGQPFFVVTQDLNERLIQTLQEVIVPRLLAEVPGQPTAAELAAEPRRHRWVICFDREGYSPKLLAQLLRQRIAAISYAKRSKSTEEWPVEEFTERGVKLVNGEEVSLAMAERGVRLSNGLWVREVRQRHAGGHQTAILSTDFVPSLEPVAAALFARWCQENFFRYMMEHYALDRLAAYGAEPIPETSLATNPRRRELENRIRQARARLRAGRAQLAGRAFPAEPSATQAAAFEREQGQWLERVRQQEAELAQLKAQRASTPRQVPLKDLPESQRFTRLPRTAKHLVDTIKMMAYRAETALVGVVRENLARFDDARTLVREVLQSSANLIPDEDQGTLTVEVHPLANPAHNAALRHRCAQLTASETNYPTTKLRRIFKFLGPD